MRRFTPAYVLIAGGLLGRGANAETVVHPSVVYAVRGDTVHEVRGDDISLLDRLPCLPHGGLKWNVLPVGRPVLCYGQWYTEAYLERLRDKANFVEIAETAAVSTGLDLWIYEPRGFRGRYLANLGYGRAMVGEVQLRNTFGGDLSVPGFGLRGGFVFHYAGSQQYRRGLLEVPTIEVPYVLSVGNWGAEIGLRSGLALLHDFEVFSTKVHERLSVIYGLYGVLAYRGAHSRGMAEWEVTRTEGTRPLQVFAVRTCFGTTLLFGCLRFEQRFAPLVQSVHAVFDFNTSATTGYLSLGLSR